MLKKNVFFFKELIAVAGDYNSYRGILSPLAILLKQEHEETDVLFPKHRFVCGDPV